MDTQTKESQKIGHIKVVLLVNSLAVVLISTCCVYLMSELSVLQDRITKFTSESELSIPSISHQVCILNTDHFIMIFDSRERKYY